MARQSMTFPTGKVSRLLISQFNDILRAARSPDLTGPDFFLWRYLKSEVNAAHAPLHPRTESPHYEGKHHLQTCGVHRTEFGNHCKKHPNFRNTTTFVKISQEMLTLLSYSFFPVPYLFPQNMTITFVLLLFHSKAQK